MDKLQPLLSTAANQYHLDNGTDLNQMFHNISRYTNSKHTVQLIFSLIQDMLERHRRNI